MLLLTNRRIDCRMKKYFWILALVFTAHLGGAQDSSGVKISLLTCAPGAELYSLFGHSAIRVQDLSTGKDEVYNYGMFSFNTPNFYVKFFRGKLRYWLGKTTFQRFLRQYEYEERAVIENEFLLTAKEKYEVENFLRNNLRRENKFYSYDFFYDNCSSRIRDVMEEVLGDKLQWPEEAQEKLPSFRDQLDVYLIDNPWPDLGIDLVLGKPTDDPADFREQMFLPDFLKDNMSKGFVQRVGEKQNFLGPSKNVLAFPHVTPIVDFYKTPLFLFFCLFVLVAILGWKIPKGWGWKIFDFALIFITGLAGLLFFFMWTTTDHQACYQNWNMLWMFPLNVLGAFLIFTNEAFVKHYFLFYGAILVLAVVGWFFWPQQYQLVFLPIMLTILLRLYFRYFLKGPATTDRT